MYDEDDFVMISALQHFLFCQRQCAFIHIEQQWTENVYTAEGRVMHERVHTAAKESRRKIKVEFDVPIRSMELGVVGRADIVEYHLQNDGGWLPFPVEYKRGRPKKDDVDRVQLCAQAICLEEMLEEEVSTGALYYGKKKKRLEVEFDQDLRLLTADTANRVHRLLVEGVTPQPKYRSACESCSFFESCLPKVAGKKDRVARYMEALLDP